MEAITGTFDKNQNKGYSIVLFLLWPFVSVFYAFRNFRAPWAKNIIWLFVIFYGYTLAISNESMDANRYRKKFLILYEQEITISNFSEFLYDEETQTLDILQPLVTSIVSRFTDNYHFLFATFGAIFGFFYSRNIWFVMSKLKGRLGKEHIILIITFTLVIGFWRINGFRFWTAAHVYFFGVSHYLIFREKKYIVPVIMSMFVHFSFMAPIAVFIIYLFCGNRLKIYFFLFVCTFFISEINVGAVSSGLTSVLPSFFHSKTEVYLSEDTVEARKAGVEKATFAKRFYEDALRWTVNVLLGLIFFKGKKVVYRYKWLLNVVSFTFLYYTVANIFSLVPSGSRFTGVANMLALCSILFYISMAQFDLVIRRITLAATPLLVYFCMLSLRIGTETINVSAIIGNPVTATVLESDTALIQVIK